jgi:hypothetical protein
LVSDLETGLSSNSIDELGRKKGKARTTLGSLFFDYFSLILKTLCVNALSGKKQRLGVPGSISGFIELKGVPSEQLSLELSGESEIR